MVDVTQQQAGGGLVDDEADVEIDAHGPEVRVLRAQEPVELQSRTLRVQLQVKGRRFDGLLLVTGQLREAGGEGVGDQEAHSAGRCYTPPKAQGMAIVEIHPKRIYGPWTEGYVLDKHVLSSVPIGYLGEHMQFDTTRSALGELVYQLKFRGGPSLDIIETASAFVRPRWAHSLDAVVSAPPSVDRTSQPAAVIAAGIGAALGLPFLQDVVRKSKTQPMKNVPPIDREDILKEAIQSGDAPVAGKRILIVDDLWQTGSTMRRVAEVLSAIGASEIKTLAMTHTK